MSVTMITRNCVHRSSVGAGSDHLQLITFWPSCAPGKGSAAGRKFLAPPTTASTQCLHLSERFFHYFDVFINTQTNMLSKWLAILL